MLAMIFSPATAHPQDFRPPRAQQVAFPSELMCWELLDMGRGFNCLRLDLLLDLQQAGATLE